MPVWVHHLRESGTALRDGGATYTFLRQHFLHWLEALTLLEKVSESIDMIDKLESLVHVCIPYSNHYSFFSAPHCFYETQGNEYSRLLHDPRRFILYFRAGFDETPLQL